MKRITITIVSALLIASTFQACCDGCLDNAETAVAGLKQDLTNTLPTGEHMCSELWNDTDGVCCNAEKVTTYWTQWETEMKNYRDQVKPEIEKVDSSSILTNLGLAHTLLSTNPTQIAAITNADSTKKQAAIDFLALAKDKMPDIENVGEALETCYSALIEFRKKVLCNRCSGRASEWYNSATSEYRVNHTSCDVLIENCGKVFGLTSIATGVLHSTRALFEDMHGATGLSGNGDLQYVGDLSKADAENLINCAEGPPECLDDFN